MQHPKTWWFRLAERLFPDRCREIPEAQNPDRIVLRQLALVKRYLYLQQFASHEDERYQHSHQWRRTFALGLWGQYTEVRLSGLTRTRRAPYFYTMDSSVVHHVQHVSPGHTSLFLGLWRDDDLKHYYYVPLVAQSRRLWSEHIKVMVKRI
jgi:hypothetical protein